MKKISGFLVCMAAALFLCGAAHALDFDFDGTFTYDNDIVLLDFTVGEESTITIFSSSWDDGGFDPILAIWNSVGGIVSEQDDGHVIGTTQSNGVWYDHGSWDSYYNVFLSAGNYSASIAQYDNFRSGSNLTDGFIHDGNPNYTFDNGWGSAPYFNSVDGTTDTGDWAFHILNVAEASQAPVPEPATMLLLGSGLVGLAGFGRKKFFRK